MNLIIVKNLKSRIYKLEETSKRETDIKVLLVNYSKIDEHNYEYKLEKCCFN